MAGPGLISQAGAPTAAPQPAALTSGAQPAEPEDAFEQAGDPATLEEQDAYDSALNMASELLHGNDAASSSFMGILADTQVNPEVNIATVVGHIMDKVEETFKGNFPEAMIIPAADEITNLVMELGEESGAFDLTDDQIANAKTIVIQDLMEAYGVTPEDYQEFTNTLTPEDVSAVQAMNFEGV